VSQDLRPRMPNWSLTQNPPLNFLNGIHWIQDNYFGSFSVASSGITESNFSFQLNQVNDYTSYQQVFDQYCIYSVCARITPNVISASTGGMGVLATAIDYDSVANLASFSSIQDFGTCNVVQVTPGISVERYLKPCVAPAVYNYGGGFNGYGTSRLWLDSASSGIAHYGLRIIFSGATVAYSGSVQITLVLGFRNSV